MKKRYFPHIVLCIHGRIFCLISVLTLSVFWYQVFFNFDEFGVVGTAITAILSILTIFVFRFLWEQIWGEIGTSLWSMPFIKTGVVRTVAGVSNSIFS